MYKRVKQGDAPHIRCGENNAAIMLDAIIALLPPYVMAYVYYGARALLLGATGVVCAAVMEYLCCLVAGKRVNLLDLTPVVTGMIVPLLLPASVPYYVVITAAVFAVLVVKFPFGGTGYNLFNPAAAGFAFASVCWREMVFTYPAPMQTLPLGMTVEEGSFAVSSCLSQMVANGAMPEIDHLDVVMGNIAGPMGVTNILVLLACAVFLILRRRVEWVVPAVYFVTICAFIWLFPRVDAGFVENALFELCGSTLLFGGVFMLGDPVTLPKRHLAKVLYSFFAAIIAMLFHYFSAFAQGAPFAILIINVFAPLFDRISETILQRIRRMRVEKEKRSF